MKSSTGEKKRQPIEKTIDSVIKRSVDRRTFFFLESLQCIFGFDDPESLGFQEKFYGDLDISFRPDSVPVEKGELVFGVCDVVVACKLEAEEGFLVILPDPFPLFVELAEIVVRQRIVFICGSP